MKQVVDLARLTWEWTFFLIRKRNVDVGILDREKLLCRRKASRKIAFAAPVCGMNARCCDE